MLGEEMYLADFTLLTPISEERSMALVDLIIQKMDMHPAHAPAFYHYPVDGKGGVGFTHVQALTESFVAVDSWPDHGGAYLSVRSCKPFNGERLRKALIEADIPVGLFYETGYLRLT